MAGWWASHGGWGAGMIEIDRAEPLTARFEVDINTADWPELVQLPGIGPTLAHRIVDSRQTAGPFVEPNDLRRSSEALARRRWSRFAHICGRCRVEPWRAGRDDGRRGGDSERGRGGDWSVGLCRLRCRTAHCRLPTADSSPVTRFPIYRSCGLCALCGIFFQCGPLCTMQLMADPDCRRRRGLQLSRLGRGKP